MILERFKGRWVGWGAMCGQLLGFAGYARKRFQADRCLSIAASLSYTSLLALVPMAAIGFAMLAAFPVFENVRHDIEMAVFENMLPDTAQHTKEYFDKFIANANRLTAVGIIGLAVTAVMLLGTIESAFNLIFRVTRARAVAPRLMMFWAVITLGPVLVGTSFSLGTYLFAAGRGLVSGAFSGVGAVFAFALPTLFMIVALTIFYIIIPNRPIKWRHALVGAVVAGPLFSALRYAFSIYVAMFPTYQSIYGALSALPIFLVWMYLSWTVVILGAVITAGLSEWRSGEGRSAAHDLAPGELFALALELLGFLFDKSRQGRRLSRSDILGRTNATDESVTTVLMRLERTGYVTAAARGEWVLSRDLAFVSLDELKRDLGLAIGPGDIPAGEESWRRKVTAHLTDVAKLTQPTLTISVRDIVADEAQPAEEVAGNEKRAASDPSSAPSRGMGPSLRQAP